LDAARAALHKAFETFRVSQREERLFKALRISLWITSGAFAVALGSLIYADAVTPEAGIPTTADIGTPMVLAVLSLLLSFIGAVVVPILLLLNWRIFRNAFRQWRLLKRLGLEEVSQTAWKAKHRGTLLDRLGTRAVKAILVLVVVIVLVFIGVSAAMGIVMNVIVGVLALVVVLTFPVWRFVETMRQRMTLALDAERLDTTLGALGRPDARGAAIVVPAAVLENAARIENAQIAAERARAIAAKSAESRDYALLTTRDVAAQKAALPAVQRLELEDLIEEVVAKPTVWPAGVEAGGSIRRARTVDNAIEIDFEIDEPARTVRVIGCRGIGAPAVGA
jgi:hypothetical protein